MKAGSPVSCNTSEISGGYFKTLSVPQIMHGSMTHELWTGKGSGGGWWGWGWGERSRSNRSSMAKQLGQDSQCVGQDSKRASPEHRSRAIRYKTLIFLFKLYSPICAYSCIRDKHVGSFVRKQVSAKWKLLHWEQERTFYTGKYVRGCNFLPK